MSVSVSYVWLVGWNVHFVNMVTEMNSILVPRGSTLKHNPWKSIALYGEIEKLKEAYLSGDLQF